MLFMMLHSASLDIGLCWKHLGFVARTIRLFHGTSASGSLGAHHRIDNWMKFTGFRAKRMRIHRKPISLGRAPSKLYFVPKKPKIDPVEYELMNEWTFHYRICMRSLRRHFALETKEVEEHQVERDFRESEDFAERIQNNDKWNQEIAEKRMHREKALQASKELEEILLQVKQEAESTYEEEKIEKELASVKLSSRTFFTEEELESQLERALDSKAVYNFAMTSGGKIYRLDLPTDTTDWALNLVGLQSKQEAIDSASSSESK